MAFFLKLKQKCMVLHIFFLDTNGTYTDLLSKDSFKPRKNIIVFESITDRKTRVSRDAHNVCAVTIVGTKESSTNSFIQSQFWPSLH